MDNCCLVGWMMLDLTLIHILDHQLWGYTDGPIRQLFTKLSPQICLSSLLDKTTNTQEWKCIWLSNSLAFSQIMILVFIPARILIYRRFYSHQLLQDTHRAGMQRSRWTGLQVCAYVTLYVHLPVIALHEFIYSSVSLYQFCISVHSALK